MPISVPPYMPIQQQQRPGIDIAGSISGLGDALQQGLEYGQKRRVDRATRAAFADGIPTGPDGLPDYMAAAGQILQGGGDMDTAMTLARLAEAQNERNWQHNRPDWQMVGSDLYNLNDLGGGQQPAGQAPVQPRTRDPLADTETVWPPEEAGQPPGQQADAGGPQPIIRGPRKPPQRRTGIDATGNTVTEEAGDDGVWRIVSGPKKTAPRARSLSGSVVNDLVEAGQNAQDINRLQSTWSDEYAGYGVGGEVANTAGKLIPGSKYADQARWWQDYQTRKNDLRHSKFGASLTPGEKAEFAKADIDPNMDPKVIGANLDRQQTILTNAAKRLAKVWIKQGYSAEAIAEAVGYTPEDLGVQPPANEGEAVPGSQENAAAEESAPEEQQGGQVVEIDGKRLWVSDDGAQVIQLD